jgi:hypothetical protein
MNPLRSLHRSPAATVAALPSDPVAPAAECARLRPMTTVPSSSSSDTRKSAGERIAVVVVLAGMTKYRPIARRTATFAALPMPPPSSAPGGETVIRWLGIGDCFLYYTPQQEKKRKRKISSKDSRGTWGKGKGKGEAVEWGGKIVGEWKVGREKEQPKGRVEVRTHLLKFGLAAPL